MNSNNNNSMFCLNQAHADQPNNPQTAAVAADIQMNESEEIYPNRPTHQQIKEMHLRPVDIHHGEWCELSNNTIYIWYSANGQPIALWSCDDPRVILYDENGDPYEDDDLEMGCDVISKNVVIDEMDSEVAIEENVQEEDNAAFGIERCDSDGSDSMIHSKMVSFEHPLDCDCGICRGEEKPDYEYEEGFRVDLEGLGTEDESWSDEEDEDS